MTLRQKSYRYNPKEAKPLWWLVDLEGKTLGRISTEIADRLRGKHRPTFTPSLDCGDFVVAINASKIKLTGKKWDDKIYYRHSNYPGGIKAQSAKHLNEKHPERLLEYAVKGMLPKNFLANKIIKKLFVYAGADHPHQAQNPQAWNK